MGSILMVPSTYEDHPNNNNNSTSNVYFKLDIWIQHPYATSFPISISKELCNV